MGSVATNNPTSSIPDGAPLIDVASGTTGPIAGLLVKRGYITPERLRYAQRIQTKLSTPQSLLRVLEDLHYVTRDQIHQALEANEGPMPLGRLLVELEIIRESELKSALALQKAQPEVKLGQILVDNGFIDEKALIEVFSLQLGYPRVSPATDRLDSDLMKRASTRWYRENEFMPLTRRDGAVSLAFVFPLNAHQRRAARKLFGDNLSIGIARRSEINEALDRYEAGRKEGSPVAVKESLVTQIVDQLISDAADANASDIHIEPMKDRLRVRFREDGILINHKEFPSDLILPIASRIKIMGGANIVERRRHQDGRVLFNQGGLSFDIRLSTYVTLHGETIVMRLLRTRSELLEVREIGMAPRMLQRYLEEVLDRPSGVVIVTGPTGSGKTTTLYASINYLNDPTTSIITAEDPVEYVVDGISQCSINPKINLTFEDTLKSIVRQDPDIIVIGEIRDAFSAETAIQAALTGHKVLTTFHTEDSIGGLLRLLNMNIEAFLISSTVVSVVAQRLVRRVCPHCSEEQTPTPQMARRLGYEIRELQGIRFKVARSCKSCKFTGYSGRVAIYELLVLDESVKDALIAHKTSFEIRRISAASTGLITLLEDGIHKALRGQTTLEEVIRQLPRLAPPRPLAELRRLLGEEL